MIPSDSATPDSGDTTLVEQAIGGDQQAFGQLVCRHNKYLLGVAHAFGANGTSEDVVQSAWLKMFRKLNHFQGDSSFKTWATRVVINTTLESHRHERKHKNTISLDVDEQREIGYDSGSPAVPINAIERHDQTLELMPEMQAIQSAIQRLAPKLRRALTLSIQGFGPAEQAAMFHQPLGTVKSEISRARKQVREFLQRPPTIQRGSGRPRPGVVAEPAAVNA